MSSFNQNFQSLVQLKKDRLGLEANQQQFDQNEAFFRRGEDLRAQRLVNDRSQFELYRAKGFMPHELNRLGLENSALGLRNQAMTDDMSFAQKDRALSLQGKEYGLSRQSRIDNRQDADYDYQATRQRIADGQQDADYNYQAGRRSVIDNRQDIDWADNQRRSDYQLGRQRITDGQQDADYGYQTGRRSVADSRQDAGYTANQASSYGYGGSRSIGFAQPQQSQPAIRSRTSIRGRYADGGPVQDAQAKGFVPVRVSNGEFEFTPEQVTNIGAAVLANSGGKAQPPMGLDSMG